MIPVPSLERFELEREPGAELAGEAVWHNHTAAADKGGRLSECAGSDVGAVIGAKVGAIR